MNHMFIVYQIVTGKLFITNTKKVLKRHVENKTGRSLKMAEE